MGEHLTPFIGELIPLHYNPGYITLSAIVSFAGCWTAVELLHRRTGPNGAHNWYLLLGAATAMAAVAIWCMHYIGNRAIMMLDASAGMRIMYSPGYTAGSAFLALCGVGTAFYFFSMAEAVTPFTTMGGGVFMGGAICGMHYVGQVGISNYECTYAWPYVLGSAIIAGTASTIALGIFFYLKSVWTNTWVKRAGVALLLATGVSGMHWCATIGTEYRLLHFAVNTMSPQHVINAVTVLASERSFLWGSSLILLKAICSCLILLAIAIISQRSRKRSADRAKQVVLACIVFDSSGRLMVNSEGLFPCRKITNTFLERSFDEVFDVDHPVFSWIFRASRCWQSLDELIPGVRSHLRKIDTARTFGDAGFSAHISCCNACLNDYETLFKELFCVTASDLAATIQEPLTNLGVLFDDVMSTGTWRPKPCLKSLLFRPRPKSPSDLEAGNNEWFSAFGQGKLLFTVRQVSKPEYSHLQASGFSFTNATNVIDHLARSMQVPRDEFETRLTRMREYANCERVLEPGVHLACFALRPFIQRGFDVLVRKDARNLLPTVKLPVPKLESSYLNLLTQMDGMTVAKCCERIRSQAALSDECDHQFLYHLLKGIVDLPKSVGSEYLEEARLVAKPFKAPGPVWGSSGDATVIAFRTITDIHEFSKATDDYEFKPLKFFMTQQHTYPGSPDTEIFARRILHEFEHILKERRTRQNSVVSHHSSHHNVRSLGPRKSYSPPLAHSRLSRLQSLSCATLNEEAASEKHLALGTPIRRPHSVHGSHEPSVRVRKVSDADTADTIELRSIEIRDDTVLEEEEESFAETLVALTIDERKRHR